MVPRTIRWRSAPLTCFCLVSALLTAMTWAQSPKPPVVDPAVKPSGTPAATPPPASAKPAANPHPAALREGTELVQQLGQFRMAGDRVTFSTEEGASPLIVLENLNLQRIVRVLSENSAPRQWKVSGTITEYCDNNYLYVQSAVLKASTELRENAAP